MAGFFEREGYFEEAFVLKAVDLRSNIYMCVCRGTAVAQWLRCCATNRKVAGSILDGVIAIFHLT